MVYSSKVLTPKCFYGLLKQISDIFVTALNQGLIQFELKANIRIIVYMTQKTLGEFLSFFFPGTFKVRNKSTCLQVQIHSVLRLHVCTIATVLFCSLTCQKHEPRVSPAVIQHQILPSQRDHNVIPRVKFKPRRTSRGLNMPPSPPTPSSTPPPPPPPPEAARQ